MEITEEVSRLKHNRQITKNRFFLTEYQNDKITEILRKYIPSLHLLIPFLYCIYIACAFERQAKLFTLKCCVSSVRMGFYQVGPAHLV